MMRLVNLAVVASLLTGAVFVYRVKYDATRHAEDVARLRLEIQREKEAIADLRAQWAQLNRPDRIQSLAERHLSLKPMTIDQMHRLNGLPPKVVIDPDPIGSMLEALIADPNAAPAATGSVPRGTAPLPPRRGEGGR